MPKSIYEMALDKSKKIRSSAGAAEGARNAALAIAAINGGIKSPAWRSYMMQFVEQKAPGQPVDPAQLERLLGTDGSLGVPDVDRQRAYLVSNAVCGPSTEFTHTIGVFGIDATLSNPGPAAAEEVTSIGSWTKVGIKAGKKHAKKGGKKAAKKR